MHLLLPLEHAPVSENELAQTSQTVLSRYTQQLRAMGIRNVNFLLLNTHTTGKRASYFNLYEETGFAEDPVSRNMRPTMPTLLELNRLTKVQ